jgi:hypothetical protein
MAMPRRGAFLVARSELRTRTALVLEAIALRHEIGVLTRNRTPHPCLGPSDRLLWILLSQWGNPRASGTLSGDNAFCSTVCWRGIDSNPRYRSFRCEDGGFPLLSVLRPRTRSESEGERDRRTTGCVARNERCMSLPEAGAGRLHSWYGRLRAEPVITAGGPPESLLRRTPETLPRRESASAS